MVIMLTAGQATASNQDVLAQYNMLSHSGALDDLEALRRENRELDMLITDAATLIALPSLPAMLDFIIGRVLEHFIPEFLAFVIEPPRGTRLTQFCYRNLKPTEEVIPLDCYRKVKAFFSEKPFATRFEAIPGDTSDYPGLAAYNPEMLFPMVGIGGLYGLVVLGRKVVGGDYTELERMYLDRLTRFLAVSIQNGLHHHSSITDAKTGLYTHDFFMRRLEEEIARMERHGNDSCTLMLDVDHFKRFNDSYGHLAGDEVLEAMASVLKSVMRTGDAVARFGGEEFCVLAVDCDETGAMEMAERIRVAVEQLRVPHEGQDLSVTVSVGVRMLDPGIEPKQLLDDADKALYSSKAAGRNRSTLFRAGLLGRAMMMRGALSSVQ
ncbi:MAG: GGDEF domain-containing protein [Spirochaetales bacterium]|nr:GGDEF domain-containing protein [Spirochaetales bacterium]